MMGDGVFTIKAEGELMTDVKPDVAALARLNMATPLPVRPFDTHNLKRYFVDGIDCHWQEHPEGWWVGYDEAEAEIARLRADHDECADDAIAIYEALKADHDVAKAEIARLTAERDQMRADYNNELQEMSERFRAVNLVECAKLYDKDAQRELSEAKAEIARLKQIARLKHLRAALKPDTGE